MEIYIHGNNGKGGLGGHLVVPTERKTEDGVTVRKYEFEDHQGSTLVITYFDYSTKNPPEAEEEEEV